MALLYEMESYKIRGAAFEVYAELGCGHKEIVYRKAMEQALAKRGLKIDVERQLSVLFNNKKVGTYTPDIIVESKVVVELKAKKALTKEDVQQFWHYLTGANFRLGLLINFGEPGGVKIVRRVYDIAREKSSA